MFDGFDISFMLNNIWSLRKLDLLGWIITPNISISYLIDKCMFSYKRLRTNPDLRRRLI